MGKYPLYYLEETFFDNPEQWTDAQAYFFGWMYTDGSCYTSKGKTNRTTLKIQESDLDVLEKFKKTIKYSGPITKIYRQPSSVMGQEIKKHQDRVCLTFSNQKIFNALQSMGIKPGKAEFLGFPDFLRKDLIAAFLRGCFEGDGTFSMGINGKFESNFIANDSFLDALEKELFFLPSFMRTDKGFKNNCKILRFAGNNNGLKFFNFIYKNHNGLFSDRKYNVFLRLVEYKKLRKLKSFEIDTLNQSIEIINENAQKKNFIQ
jgi:hypothetical protein